MIRPTSSELSDCVLQVLGDFTSALSWYQSQSFYSRQELVTSFHTLLTLTLVACTETSRLFEGVRARSSS